MAIIRRRIRGLCFRVTKIGKVNVKGQGDSGTLESGGGADTRLLIRFERTPILKKLTARWIGSTGFVLRPTAL